MLLYSHTNTHTHTRARAYNQSTNVGVFSCLFLFFLFVFSVIAFPNQITLVHILLVFSLMTGGALLSLSFFIFFCFNLSFSDNHSHCVCISLSFYCILSRSFLFSLTHSLTIDLSLSLCERVSLLFWFFSSVHIAHMCAFIWSEIVLQINILSHNFLNWLSISIFGRCFYFSELSAYWWWQTQNYLNYCFCY